jgi:hypothetical protein
MTFVVIRRIGVGVSPVLRDLISPHISPGSGILGQSGKAGWAIARRSIAVAMVQGGLCKLQSQMVPKTG